MVQRGARPLRVALPEGRRLPEAAEVQPEGRNVPRQRRLDGHLRVARQLGSSRSHSGSRQRDDERVFRTFCLSRWLRYSR